MKSMPSARDPLLTAEQAAEQLTLSVKTLAIWRCTNRQALPFVKLGGRVAYRQSDLDAFIAQRVQNAPSA